MTGKIVKVIFDPNIWISFLIGKRLFENNDIYQTVASSLLQRGNY